jgi:hypothetical protein
MPLSIKTKPRGLPLLFLFELKRTLRFRQNGHQALPLGLIALRAVGARAADDGSGQLFNDGLRTKRLALYILWTTAVFTTTTLTI